MMSVCREKDTTFGRDWGGYYFGKDPKDFFLGVYYDRPDILVFETYKCAFVPELCDGLGIGCIVRGNWRNEIDLISDEFFCLTAEDQMKRVEDFISESLNAAEKIKLISSSST